MDTERFVIGVDIGGTKTAAALVRARRPRPERPASADTETPEIVERFTAATDTSSPEATVRGIVDCVARLRQGSVAAQAVGVGVASMVDFAAGRVIESVNLPLADVALRDLLYRRFSLPTVIDNDANVAALGEWAYGAGVGARDMIMLTLGTGVGGGIVSGGRPLRGFSGAAGELGHLIIDMDGVKCPANCPSWGCLEAYAAGSAMGAAARAAAEQEPSSGLGRASAAGRSVDGRLLTRLAREGDAAAIRVLERTGEYLGVGLVSLSNIFDPELFVIGGGAAAAGDLLLEPARRVFATRALRPARDRVRIVSAALGPEAGVVGAAALALLELFPPGRSA
ncbi:MAG TPA: ROK family protein [Thermoleophilia bacterium]|nr:ROK family protein [Thermoleophilia bacterium]